MQNSSRQQGPAEGSTSAADLLASASLFSSFSRNELEFLAEKSEFLDFDAGQGIFEAGDPGGRLYLIASGSVVILSPEGGGVLAEFVRGDSFGELELLTGTARNAGARAEGKARLLAFPAGGAGLKEALSGRPQLAARILRSFLLVIAGRTRKSNALVKENSPWVRELKRQVYGDKLTGLLNKAYLEENLPKMIGSPASPSALALVMMKPDNFKDINDRFGHEAGDAALVLMAGELDKAVGTEGTAVRYMGNELAVVYQGKDRAGALEAARAIQARICALDLSALTGEQGLRFSLSLGIALSPEHGAEAEALIKTASGLPLAGRARGGSLILFPEDGE
jgi:diguanylate cyclase (GGDEF)-like protein